MAATDPKDFDDSQLVGIISSKLKFAQELAMTVGQLEYEIDRVRKANEANQKLLVDLRQRLFYQNNMELVKMIDERKADV